MLLEELCAFFVATDYFINLHYHSVLTEESDINLEGNAQSHFSMYLEAMEDMKVSTDEVKSFVKVLNMKLLFSKQPKESVTRDC
jgi:hypothetical protein